MAYNTTFGMIRSRGKGKVERIKLKVESGKEKIKR